LLSLEIEIKFICFPTRRLLEILYSVVGIVHSSSSSSNSNSNKNSSRVPDGNQILTTGLLVNHCTKLITIIIIIIIIVVLTTTILYLTKSAVRGVSTDQSGLLYVHIYPVISSC